MPAFPAIDLTKFDLSKIDLSKLDLSKIDLSKIDLPDFNIPGLDRSSVRSALRDGAYIAIGTGVLTFQQAQVRRRELTAAINNSDLPRQAEAIVSMAQGAARSVVRQVGDLVRSVN